MLYMKLLLLLFFTLVLFTSNVEARRNSPDCPGGCIIASVPGPQRECKCVVPNCSWQKAFGLRSTRRRKVNGRMTRPKAARLGAPDCNFCESGALTYDTFAECYGAEAAFIPEGPSISAASYPELIEGRLEAVAMTALVTLEDLNGPATAATAPAPAPAAAADTAIVAAPAPAAPTAAGQEAMPAAGAVPAAVMTEAAAAQSAPVVGGIAVLDSAVEPLALMAAVQPLTAAAATAGQTGSRRLMAKGQRRQLLQTCPPANPCLDTSTMVRWETLFGTTTATSDVTIPTGTQVVLHGCAQLNSTVNVRSVRVPAGATLVIGDSPLNLNLQSMNISGTFQMGTAACPIKSLINVFIPGGTSTFGIFAMSSASFDVHGSFTGGITWTRIASTVLVGAKSIPLVEAVQWKAGDKFVLTTTSWKDEIVNQNEVLTVASVANGGLTVNTVEALQFNHYGKEYKAEVGLLSRGILFTSDTTSTSTGVGPHTLLMTPNARLSGAGFERWGARNIAGHYSIHYHLAGETTNAFVRNCAVYNSNWRCITVHGTHGVTLQGNVGFNVHGHCYYLEDGVEERNVIDRNLAAYVHPIQTAGSGGGQQGTDRWQSATLFDPTDAGAGGFYALNAYNTWTNNAASGGFAGFSFPHAPRPIKDHKNLKKPDGYPFNPGQRPFILFKGNTVHSTGYNWEHGGGIYFGGMIFEKLDPSDNKVKLFYNNGRGSIQANPGLCPDPNWPAADSGNANSDCWVNAARSTRNAADTGEGFLVVEDATVSLANVGVMSWGDRIEVKGLQAYDVTRGATFLGQSWLTNSLIKINTDNTVNGWSNWPFSSTEYYWSSWPVKGFEWYDTMTTSMLSNVTFENYKYKSYTTNPADWWYWQTPHAFRMLSHSDQYKPDKTMMVTKGIRCINCDYGTCSGGKCTGGAFFRVDQTYRGAHWLFNWLDQDGSVVHHVAPSKPAGPYLITAAPDWWQLDDTTSWKEPLFGGEYGPIWVSPMPANEVAARLEMRVQSAGGSRYTVGAFDGEDVTRIGYVSQFGNVAKQVVMTKTEGTTGMTGPYGWYTVWNTTSPTTYTAPKRVELVLFNVPRQKWVYWTACWPAGTSFTVRKTFDWNSCQNFDPLSPVSTRDALLRSGGNNYWIDANNCLHLKLTDPGSPTIYTDSFTRDDMYIEEEIRWYDLKYTITATGTAMSCADTFFCPLPGDPASRVPAAINSQPATCQDVQPADYNCNRVKCGWSYWPGCSNTAIVSGGLCQASCNTCPAPPVSSPSPSPKPSPSPSPSPSPKLSPSPSPQPSPSPSPSPKLSPSPAPKPSPSPSPAPAIMMNLAITMTRANSGSTSYTCKATVTVTTTTGAKVGGVMVTGTWSSRLNDWAAYDVTPTTPTSGTTLGVVSSTSKALKRTPGGGCYFTVKNAVRTGYSLNPTTTKIGQYLW